MMRVLVTGAAGQLGRDVVRTWQKAGDTVLAADRSVLDVTHREAVHEAVAEWRPDVVVNCAAWTAVDACEADPERARAVNGHAVRWLAEAVDSVGARLVHVSTDYVFDGAKSSPYLENDVTHPQCVYGQTKLLGENEALALGDAATVVRTSWVCSAHGGNMVATVRRLLAEGSPMSFVDDQRGCPTFTADLAPALRQLAVDRNAGVFHLTNAGAVSWYEFVREIVAAFGGDPAAVRPITTAELDPPRPARRPANSVLENAAWAALGQAPLRDHRDALAELAAV